MSEQSEQNKLDLLIGTMREFSDTSGDHHWLAAAKLEQQQAEILSLRQEVAETKLGKDKLMEASREILEQQKEEIRDLSQQLVKGELSKDTIKKMVLENGMAELTMEGNIMHVFSYSFIELFRKSNAVNYLESTFTDVDNGEDYVVTMQKVSGITPAVKANALEVRCQDLETKIATLEAAQNE